MSDLNWNLRDILHEFKDSRLHVFVSIFLHKNTRNRSWPSNELIATETGLSSAPISAAIQWLIEKHVVVLVPFEKRVGLELKLPNRKNIYQLTGVVLVGEEYYPYMNLTPEGWQSIASDLDDMGNCLLSKQLNDVDSLLSKRLDSKRKGIKGIALDSEGDKKDTFQSPAQPGNSNTIEGIPPSPKRKPVRSEKLTPLQMWLARLPAVKPVVCALLTSCYEGWDSVMMSPENSLTVQQLEKYITNAEEYIRLGGSAGEVGQVYEFIGEVDYTIAPQTIAGHYLRWKASQQPDKPVVAAKPVEAPKVVMTEVERAARLEQMKADKVALFG